MTEQEFLQEWEKSAKRFADMARQLDRLEQAADTLIRRCDEWM